MGRRISKKQKQIIKKYFTPLTVTLMFIFLVIGVVIGYGYQTMFNKPTDETKISLLGEEVVELNLGEKYQEEGFAFIINGVDYHSDVVVDDSDVDYQKVGWYQITYTLEHQGKKIALERVIKVIGGDANE